LATETIMSSLQQSEGQYRMKVLIASTPLTGHLNPLLAIARILLAEGHEVVGMSSNAMRNRIEGVGVKFLPFTGAADLDLSDFDAAFPEKKTYLRGLC
jgi:UDP:flavonoid glycosyltransferase YjiC (YdhE family)